MVAADRSTEARLLQIIVVLVGILASALSFYPGCMSNDALFSWNEALNKPAAAYYDWHPPLVAFIWMLLNELPVSVIPQYATLFIAMTALFWVGIALAGQPWI